MQVVSPQEEVLPSAGEMTFVWDTPRDSSWSSEIVPAKQMNFTREPQIKGHAPESMVPLNTTQRPDNPTYAARPSSPTPEEKRILAEAQYNMPGLPDNDDVDDDDFEDEDL